MSEKNITLVDVANLAGVSRATAGRALSNNPNVAKNTKEKVLKAAKELDYKPDMVFSIMASRRKSKKDKSNLVPIALLQGDKSSSIEECLLTHGQDFGFCIEKIEVNQYADTAKLKKQLYYRGYVGIILYSVDPGIIDRMDFSHYSVINLHRGEDADQKFNSVRPDRFNDLMNAWKKAMDAGHKRIGAAICLQNVSSYDDGLRYGAVCECQRLWGKKIEYIPPFLGGISDNEEFLEWYNEYKPTCIIGFQVHFYWLLRDNGIKIPETVSYISLIVSDENTSKISGLKSSDNEAAIVGLSYLDQMVRNRVRDLPVQPVSLYVVSKWTPGTTLRDISKK